MELQLIKNLINIYFISKLLHWNATNNYADHLLYDRISEDCIEFTDKIAENCILPFETNVLNRLELYGALTPSVEDLKNLIIDSANMIQTLCANNEISEGAKNTLSGIAESLNTKAYLLKDK